MAYFTKWNLNSSSIPSIKNHVVVSLYDGQLSGKWKQRQEVGVLLINVTLPPLDKCILFQLTNLLTILSIPFFQIDFNLNEIPKGRPRYFIGKEDTFYPRIEAKSSKLGTFPTQTCSDLSWFTFNSETASKHRRSALKFRCSFGCTSTSLEHVRSTCFLNQTFKKTCAYHMCNRH